MSRASVLLPLPLSPTTPTNSLSRSAKLTSRTAAKSERRNSPPEANRLVRPDMSRIVVSTAVVFVRRDRGCRDIRRPRGADAGGGMSRAHLDEGRRCARAVGNRVGTARREGATRHGVVGAKARHALGQRVKPAPLAHRGIRELQAARVGVAGRRKHLARRPVFGGAARIEHQNVVAHLRGEPQVVGDEHHRGILALLHLGDQPHDARLDRHVERGGRLVGDDQLRAAGKRKRDQHALAHAAGELMRIARQQLGAVRQVDRVEQFEHPLAPIARRDADARQMLVELRADGQHRVERGQRLLRNERDLAAEQRAARVRRHRDEIGDRRTTGSRRSPRNRAEAAARWCGRPSICRRRIRRPARAPRPGSSVRTTDRGSPARVSTAELRATTVRSRAARTLMSAAPFGEPHVERAAQPSPSRLKPSTVTKIARIGKHADSRATDRRIAAHRRSSGPRRAWSALDAHADKREDCLDDHRDAHFEADQRDQQRHGRRQDLARDGAPMRRSP